VDVTHVPYVASIPEECYKRLFKIFYLCLHVCCKRFDLDVAYVSHICFNIMLQMFHLFQPSVAASVFMLQVFYPDVAYVFTHMLKVYVPDVSSVSDVYCIQVFHVICVSCVLES
jgi:hypothetical protein